MLLTYLTQLHIKLVGGIRGYIGRGDLLGRLATSKILGRLVLISAYHL